MNSETWGEAHLVREFISVCGLGEVPVCLLFWFGSSRVSTGEPFLPVLLFMLENQLGVSGGCCRMRTRAKVWLFWLPKCPGNIFGSNTTAGI